MSNNLKNLEKELRSYAKRVKGLSYTNGLLIAFLLTGMISLSATIQTDKAITQTKNDIVDTTIQVRQAFINAKRDNDRLIKNSNLELIKLMEQGDQVVKSPWSSWQIGMNTYLKKNNGTYKKVTEIAPNKLYTDPLEKYIFSKKETSYGTLKLKLIEEPIVELTKEKKINLKIKFENKKDVDKKIEIQDISVPNFSVDSVPIPKEIEKNVDIKPVPEPKDIGVHMSIILDYSPGEVNKNRRSNYTIPDGTKEKFILELKNALENNANNAFVEYYSRNLNSKKNIVRDIKKRYTDENIRIEKLDKFYNDEFAKIFGSDNNSGIRADANYGISKMCTEDLSIPTTETRYCNPYIETPSIGEVGLKAGEFKIFYNTNAGNRYFYKNLITDKYQLNRRRIVPGPGTRGEGAKYKGMHELLKNLGLPVYQNMYLKENQIVDDNEKFMDVYSFYGHASTKETIIGKDVTMNLYSTKTDTDTCDIDRASEGDYGVYCGNVPNSDKIANVPNLFLIGNIIRKEKENEPLSESISRALPESKLINEGNINLFAGMSSVVQIEARNSVGKIVFENEGKIRDDKEINNTDINWLVDTSDFETLQTEYANHNFGIFNSGNTLPGYDWSRNDEHIIKNGERGEIKFFAPKSVGWRFSEVLHGERENDLTNNIINKAKKSVINDGVFKLYGYESVGVNFSKFFTVPTTVAYANIQLNKPLEILGDESAGAYISVKPLDESDNIVKVDNFSKSKWNIKIGGLDTENNEEQNLRYGNKGDGSPKKIENSTGLYFDFYTKNDDNKVAPLDLTTNKDTVSVKNYNISLEKDAENSVAIRVKNAKIELDDTNIDSKITIKGDRNVGILSENSNNGELIYKNINNSIEISENTKDNVIFAAQNDSKIKLENKFNFSVDKSEGLIGFYSNNGKINLENGIKYNQKGDNSVLGYAKNNGSINIKNNTFTIPVFRNSDTINNDTLPEPDVTLEGENSIGFYSVGSNIVSKNLKMKLNDGATLAYSENGTSSIDLSNSYLDFSTNKGYALYSKNGGKINVDNSMIVLRKNTVGFKLNDLSTGNISTNNTNIIMMSNKAIPFDLGSISTINASNISTSLGIPSTLKILNGKEGSTTYNKYKIAFIDGVGSLNIDTNLNSKYSIDDSNESSLDVEKKASYDYYRRYEIQRAKINLNSGKIVTSVLNSNDLLELNKNNIIALSSISSTNATNNSETGITLNSNSKIIADREDSGRGAVGLYTNYGKIFTDATSEINVEKENNMENPNGVGIYAVNGTEVKNEGIINVGGESSFGIVGLAYGLDQSGNVFVNQFGNNAINQGSVSIENKGTISLSGKKSTGIAIDNNNYNANNTTSILINNTSGNIIMKGDNSVGLFSKKSKIENKGNIEMSNKQGIALFGIENSEITNNGTIKLKNGILNKENIGMYTTDENTKLINSKDIIGEDYTYGIYGKDVVIKNTSNIKLKNNSVGIYLNAEFNTTPIAPNVDLVSDSKIKVGDDSISVLVSGEKQNIQSNSTIEMGKNSYAYLLQGKENTFKSLNPVQFKLIDNSKFIYSNDKKSTIENKTPLYGLGKDIVGIYSAGNVLNLGDIDFSDVIAGEGLYSVGGIIENGTYGASGIRPIIKVGKSDSKNEKYSAGMISGYVNNEGVLEAIGTIKNYGTIKVEHENSIGMYAVGSGSKAENYGKIELSAKNSIGMYLTDKALGINYGEITTTPTAENDGIRGVVIANDAILKNYGTINIIGSKNIAVEKPTGQFFNDGTTIGKILSETSPNGASDEIKPTKKEIKNLKIEVLEDGTGIITRNGIVVTPVSVDTVSVDPASKIVNVDRNNIIIKKEDIVKPSNTKITSLGMYIDTSGINYTKPINGLEKLNGLQQINLILGNEASRYTNDINIKVGENILKPYNDVMALLNDGTKFELKSASLTWMANSNTVNGNILNNIYLVKYPYTNFSTDDNVYNFLEGLEQRYKWNDINSKEKEVFNKLNSIGQGEPEVLIKSFDEMMGHQYANIQMRIKNTGDQLNKEFEHLMKDWYNPSKQNNKIKVFGMKEDYNTDTAGIKDFESNSYGVAYVHEDETIKLGENSGWYTGLIYNRFRFKDIGKSVEDQNMLKLGVFKTRAYDNNGSLKWKVSVDGFVGMNDMERQYLVVDEIFGAKSRYYTYGIGLRNEVSKDYRLSEHVSLMPYGSLNVEYGRFTTIKEKKGEVRLEIKGNHYISVKPEVGAELKYSKKINSEFKLTLSAGIAYELELGKVYEANNKARVNYTNADWYNLANEKENRTGNLKGDFKFGLEKNRFGLTLNVGYDTRGNNLRGGIGLRAVY